MCSPSLFLFVLFLGVCSSTEVQIEVGGDHLWTVGADEGATLLHSVAVTNNGDPCGDTDEVSMTLLVMGMVEDPYVETRQIGTNGATSVFPLLQNTTAATATMRIYATSCAVSVTLNTTWYTIANESTPIPTEQFNENQTSLNTSLPDPSYVLSAALLLVSKGEECSGNEELTFETTNPAVSPFVVLLSDLETEQSAVVNRVFDTEVMSTLTPSATDCEYVVAVSFLAYGVEESKEEEVRTSRTITATTTNVIEVVQTDSDDDSAEKARMIIALAAAGGSIAVFAVLLICSRCNRRRLAAQLRAERSGKEMTTF